MIFIRMYYHHSFVSYSSIQDIKMEQIKNVNEIDFLNHHRIKRTQSFWSMFFYTLHCLRPSHDSIQKKKIVQKSDKNYNFFWLLPNIKTYTHEQTCFATEYGFCWKITYPEYSCKSLAPWKLKNKSLIKKKQIALYSLLA